METAVKNTASKIFFAKIDFSAGLKDIQFRTVISHNHSTGIPLEHLFIVAGIATDQEILQRDTPFIA